MTSTRKVLSKKCLPNFYRTLMNENNWRKGWIGLAELIQLIYGIFAVNTPQMSEKMQNDDFIALHQFLQGVSGKPYTVQIFVVILN